MTLSERFRLFVSQTPAPAIPAADAVVPAPLPVFALSSTAAIETDQPALPSQITDNAFAETRPHWLDDRDTLRDEGVLFGLSEAGPDEKVAEIQAYFRHQAVPAEVHREQYAAEVDELNRMLEQRETQVALLQERIDRLTNQPPVANNWLRTVVSLSISAAMCIGTFYLIDETLRPVFPNHWIAVCVFMAGMFNLSGHTSFFHEEGSRLTGRRLVTEIGLPLAASVFILVQASQTQSVVQAGALFIFVFSLFLLAGKSFLTSFSTLQNDIAIRQMNRQRVIDERQNAPYWETQTALLRQQIDDLRAQRLTRSTVLRTAEASLTQLNTRRDELVNLFLSEFELARSIRYRLSEQQRTLRMNYE